MEHYDGITKSVMTKVHNPMASRAIQGNLLVVLLLTIRSVLWFNPQLLFKSLPRFLSSTSRYFRDSGDRPITDRPQTPCCTSLREWDLLPTTLLIMVGGQDGYSNVKDLVSQGGTGDGVGSEEFRR
ncbi:hypothetical protein K457DRAFT_23254 [Linnemannia elongata AG-77]|uniref:Uncharacterized protein n=1 Tax=Linnemannia elongata AG-77 TaxID=1314771 RepID=A0A197JK12_9FUNG|nr:hypothetical protein K457DRAFT_23254 [Linnemannia elongata AG-77]